MDLKTSVFTCRFNKQIWFLFLKIFFQNLFFTLLNKNIFSEYLLQIIGFSSRIVSPQGFLEFISSKSPIIIPFVPNAPFLLPPKISENRKVFWCFRGIEKGWTENEWVKIACEDANFVPDAAPQICLKVFSFNSNMYFLILFEKVL